MKGLVRCGSMVKNEGLGDKKLATQARIIDRVTLYIKVQVNSSIKYFFYLLGKGHCCVLM